MNNVNTETRRVVGGNSFIDSIIRTNSNTEEYVKYVISIINKKLFEDEKVITYKIHQQTALIYCNKKKVIENLFEEIETFRQKSILTFDMTLLELIKLKINDFDETSNYYKRVNGMINS